MVRDDAALWSKECFERRKSREAPGGKLPRMCSWHCWGTVSLDDGLAACLAPVGRPIWFSNRV